MRNEPQPLSHTARGEKMIANKALKQDIVLYFMFIGAANGARTRDP